ncbi:MAG: sigma-54-dependent Fis family transcriptional regulator [Paenibacillus macerans]|uniref:Bacterial regulatory, Fis family protein n=1 Tax=Paenibacillus macerans TaxID=44252 RepID=A0A090Z211_PAEMA|nr:sigma-54-dependent Fis family transcriptional regulator [Paenibacillus macerans]KFM98460.1 bacterial regulatory, Fis family protein [Paenibacillus macerans]MCY7560461.1 sigma-54-dependent Fis family transcriptional regulator [Paenibacillus macerans]MDU7475727.1 sigma-54-dependent Fis family transcriptional regulator [Paenibacillus macerans]MEC0150768.1 sigma-54-dependent Fis family transcriptional regulator [Paenibacillus macerans]MEC0329661.1 sigma-54-dependent Fis family transcriptional r
MLISYEKSIENWEQFTKYGTITADTRMEIAESWIRCSEAGVDPLHGRGEQVSSAELSVRLNDRKQLIAVARPVMNSIFQIIKSTVYGIVLTDQDGVILETVHHETIEPECAKVNFFQGARWDERSVGTNAVGTALATGRPIQVLGGEHYCTSHHPWTCSAAPIRDSRGNIIGCLDLSGKVEDVHIHTFGIVVSAVISIQEQLNVMETNGLMDTVFNSMMDGLLLIDTEYRIQRINSRLASIFRLDANEIYRLNVREMLNARDIENVVFRGKQHLSYADCTIKAGDQRVDCMVNIFPYEFNNRVLGAAILIREAGQVRKAVNQIAGFKANYSFEDIVTRHPAMLETIAFAKKIARTDCTVLIEGESGTGKELFAQSIHQASSRANGPFIAINCAALPKELVESELFGYEKGSFTGALREGSPGKFELAHGGTLFLDEVGELSLEIQAKLLRVLDNHKVRRIGGRHERTLDVRVIAATNRDLEEEVALNSYRSDLYYRLNVINIKLLPLRERQEDTAELAKMFLHACNRENPGPPKKFSASFLGALQRQEWKGNVRELQNIVKRAYYVSEAEIIDESHLPEGMRISRHDGGAALPQHGMKSLRDREREDIVQALQACGGNAVSAAKLLNIGKSTIYRKIGEYGIRGRWNG